MAQYDFYYSRKALADRISKLKRYYGDEYTWKWLGYINYVTLNGDQFLYTEMIRSGKKPLTAKRWDDLDKLGSENRNTAKTKRVSLRVHEVQDLTVDELIGRLTNHVE